MKIGFIGLGIMGSRMAANLQKQGHSLFLFNRTRAKAEPLLGRCGNFVDSPAELARQVDVLFTMLADPDAVEQAALGFEGFLNFLRPNALWIDCSSVNSSFSKRMAAAAARREVHLVDAPVTGSAPVAEEAKLTFWVGADPADLEAIRSLLLCMGNRIVHTGRQGTGTSMKMVINLLLGNAMAAFGEAMALGEGLGLSQKLLFDSLLGMPAVAPFIKAKREKIDNRDYEAEFPLRWMQKDMHLATVSAYEAGVAMPLTNVAKEMYRLAMRDGHATEDFSAIYEFLTSNSHSVPVTTTRPSVPTVRNPKVATPRPAQPPSILRRARQRGFVSGLVLTSILVLGVELLFGGPPGPTDGNGIQPGADAGWSALITSMEEMHMAMGAVKRSGDNDIDFVRLMIPHHQAAIDMAKAQLLDGKDSQMRRLAQEIITDQQSEIELMQQWLRTHQSVPSKGSERQATKTGKDN